METFKKMSRAKRLGCMVVPAMCVPAFAHAQDTNGDAPAAPSQVVVTGYKKSYTDALIMKRQNIGVGATATLRLGLLF